jgi:hypothetical protein
MSIWLGGELETSTTRQPRSKLGCCATKEKDNLPIAIYRSKVFLSIFALAHIPKVN